MKLAKIAIENFRHLGTTDKPFVLSFTDPLDRVRDFTLLVGPNTSGKTTILDAIALALGRNVGTAALRPDFKVSPRSVVRRGELNARVTCWLRFSPEEIAATREIFGLAKVRETVPEMAEVELTWTYPAPQNPTQSLGSWTNLAIPYSVGTTFLTHPLSDFGDTQTEPEEGWVLLHGRDQAARLLSTGRADWSWLHRVGGVFTFDQDRTGLGKTVSRQLWNIVRGIQGARPAPGGTGGTGGTGATGPMSTTNEEIWTADPRTILIELALQSLVPSIASTGQTSDAFRLIQERYARVCHPRSLVRAVRDELGDFDVCFTDGKNEYYFDGLSSGEKNVLLLLIRFVTERMHRSIVLIDELELNQHPIWQRKLLHMIPQMGDDNQIIATTHSPYLRDAVRPDAVIDLGDLGDHRPEGTD